MSDSINTGVYSSLTTSPSGEGVPGTPSFLTGDQSSAPWYQDPVGYMLFHKGNPNAAAPNPMAGMSQEAWQYYTQNIVPMQQQTFQQLFSPNALTQAQTQAKSDVDTQFTNAGSAFTREAQSLGVVPSAAQSAAQNKTMALNQGMAEASAENQATAAVSAQRSKYLGI